MQSIGTKVRLKDRCEALGDDIVSEIWVQEGAKNDLIKILKQTGNKTDEILNIIDQDVLDSLDAVINEGSLQIVSGSTKSLNNQGPIIVEATKEEFVAEHVFSRLFNKLAIIRTFKNVQELKRFNNISDYTTSVGLYSNNKKKLDEAIDSINLGLISVNCLPETDFRVPRGSGINSQLGKSMGKYAFTNLTNMKPVFINTD